MTDSVRTREATPEPDSDLEQGWASPQSRLNLVGHQSTENALCEAIAAGALTNGWLVTGGTGIGKATLAFRIARALLDPGARTGDGLEVAASSKGYALIAAGAHPDLFVARRQINEKTGRQSAEITVETVRELIGFFSQTAGFGGWRVAIVDTADDLNRNAANALLKVLEEPPPRTLLLLLSSTPGRLLATIRSRCRRLVLRPVATSEIAAFLEAEGVAAGSDAQTLAEAARGRPGRALRLAAEEGVEALQLVGSLVRNLAPDADRETRLEPVRFGDRNGEALFRSFADLLGERLTDQVCAAVEGAAGADRIRSLVALRDDAQSLMERGAALNLDRSQVVSAIARLVRNAR